MLKYQTTQGERIRKVFDVVAPILMDGNIVFDKAKGFTISGLTENLFVKLTMPPTGSESLQCWGPNVTLGVDFRLLAAWLRGVSKGDIISFEAKKKILNGSKPTLDFLRWNDVMNDAVKLPVLDIDPIKMEPMEVDYDAVVTVPAAHLDSVLKSHAVGAKEASIRCTKSKQTDLDVLEIESFGKIPAVTGRPLPSCADTVVIHLADGKPLKLSYPLGTVGQLDFIISGEDQVNETKKKKNKKPAVELPPPAALKRQVSAIQEMKTPPPPPTLKRQPSGVVVTSPKKKEKACFQEEEEEGERRGQD